MKDFSRRHPTFASIIYGAIVGAVIGFIFIGNFGVAARGNAVGVWGWAVGTIIGGYIGFRIDEWRSKKRK